MRGGDNNRYIEDERHYCERTFYVYRSGFKDRSRAFRAKLAKARAENSEIVVRGHTTNAFHSYILLAYTGKFLMKELEYRLDREYLLKELSSYAICGVWPTISEITRPRTSVSQQSITRVRISMHYSALTSFSPAAKRSSICLGKRAGTLRWVHSSLTCLWTVRM